MKCYYETLGSKDKRKYIKRNPAYKTAITLSERYGISLEGISEKDSKLKIMFTLYRRIYRKIIGKD